MQHDEILGSLDAQCDHGLGGETRDLGVVASSRNGRLTGVMSTHSALFSAIAGRIQRIDT